MEVILGLLVHIHPLLQPLLMNWRLSLLWETHTSTILLYREKNATQKMVQELYGSSLSSWGFKHLPGKCFLPKRKLCLPLWRADPLSFCEHLNQNIREVNVFVMNLVIISYIDTTTKEFKCLENSLCVIEHILGNWRIFWNEGERSKQPKMPIISKRRIYTKVPFQEVNCFIAEPMLQRS